MKYKIIAKNNIGQILGATSLNEISAHAVSNAKYRLFTLFGRRINFEIVLF